MDIRTKQQLKELETNFMKSFIQNWRLILVNVTGLIGLDYALNIISIGLKMFKGNVPQEFYFYLTIFGFAFGMFVLYRLLQFNANFAISKLKEVKCNKNN